MGANCNGSNFHKRSTRIAALVWRPVAMGGGGFVSGIFFHLTEKDLRHARTDVDGVYHWDDKQAEWVALNDWPSPADNNFAGIESIGLDSSDPNRLYLAAGTYASGAATILRSADQGRTFQYNEVPFRMGGNADGRHNGERLAVDPNEGTILYFGSRSEGLWESVDRGATWNSVKSFVTPVTPARPVAASTNTAAGGRRGGGGGFGGNQPGSARQRDF